MHIMSREALHQLGKATKNGNWNLSLKWSERAVQELGLDQREYGQVQWQVLEAGGESTA
jgi:hypothetical protein